MVTLQNILVHKMNTH